MGNAFVRSKEHRAIDDYPEWHPHLHDLGQCEVKHDGLCRNPLWRHERPISGWASRPPVQASRLNALSLPQNTATQDASLGGPDDELRTLIPKAQFFQLRALLADKQLSTSRRCREKNVPDLLTLLMTPLFPHESDVIGRQLGGSSCGILKAHMSSSAAVRVLSPPAAAGKLWSGRSTLPSSLITSANQTLEMNRLKKRSRNDRNCERVRPV